MILDENGKLVEASFAHVEEVIGINCSNSSSDLTFPSIERN